MRRIDKRSRELLDDESVPMEVVDCTKHVRGKLDEGVRSQWHTVFRPDGKVPTRTDISCWHDANPFSGQPVTIPVAVDARKRTYEHYGIFCSVNCAKRYIIETDSNISSHRMLDFNMVMRDVHGIRGNIRPAPTKSVLKQFGGHMSLAEFRSGATEIATKCVPMVPTPILFEERDGKTAEEQRKTQERIDPNRGNPGNSFERYISECKENEEARQREEENEEARKEEEARLAALEEKKRAEEERRKERKRLQKLEEARRREQRKREALQEMAAAKARAKAAALAEERKERKRKKEERERTKREKVMEKQREKQKKKKEKKKKPAAAEDQQQEEEEKKKKKKKKKRKEKRESSLAPMQSKTLSAFLVRDE